VRSLAEPSLLLEPPVLLAAYFVMLSLNLGLTLVVNDLGSTHTGDGSSAEPAHILAKELSDLGYSAIANTYSILDAQKIVDATVKAFGKMTARSNNAA